MESISFQNPCFEEQPKGKKEKVSNKVLDDDDEEEDALDLRISLEQLEEMSVKMPKYVHNVNNQKPTKDSVSSLENMSK